MTNKDRQKAIDYSKNTSCPFIYVPIPKIANTSTKATLYKWTHPNKPIPRTEFGFDVHKESLFPWISLSKLAVGIPAKNCKLFVFVRNPIDRVISVYQQKVLERRVVPNPMIKLGVSKKMTINDFIEEIVLKSNVLECNVHWRSVEYWIKPIENNPVLDIVPIQKASEYWSSNLSSVTPLFRSNETNKQTKKELHRELTDKNKYLLSDMYKYDLQILEKGI